MKRKIYVQQMIHSKGKLVDLAAAPGEHYTLTAPVKLDMKS